MSTVIMEQEIRFDYDSILDCVHCGLCLPSCPSYAVLGTETDSPRGRIFLMKSVADGTITTNQTFKKHFDLCLGCRGCETACPSGVKYHELFETAQQLIHQNIKLSLISRTIKTTVLNRIFLYPSRLRLMFRLLKMYQLSGIQKFVRSTGLLKLVSKNLDDAERFLPKFEKNVSGEEALQVNGDSSGQEQKIGLLRGCVMDLFAPETNNATIRILNKCGYAVQTSEKQRCCGAIHLHNREAEPARLLARRMIDEFEKMDVEYIITNAAGCGSMLKEYDKLLSGDTEYSEKAARFSAKVRDISEFLAEGDTKLEFGNVNRSVVYDDPCHLIHGQKIKNQPRQLLAAVPGLEIRTLNEAEMCCGGAGTFNITQPELSKEVLKRKIDNIRHTGADTIVSANIGCIIQLKRGVQLAGMDLEVCHVVDILDESLGNAKNASADPK